MCVVPVVVLVMWICTLGVLSLGVVGKIKCWACGLNASGLGGRTGFLKVEVCTRMSLRFIGFWMAFITSFLCRNKVL